MRRWGRRRSHQVWPGQGPPPLPPLRRLATRSPPGLRNGCAGLKAPPSLHNSYGEVPSAPIPPPTLLLLLPHGLWGLESQGEGGAVELRLGFHLVLHTQRHTFCTLEAMGVAMTEWTCRFCA